MGHFLENIYDVLFHPFAAMPRIAAEKPLGQSVAAFLIGVCIPAGATFFALKTGDMQKMFVIMVITQVFAGFVIWFCSSAVLSLIAELFGGRGTALGLFAAMGFTHIPRILAVPLFVVAALLSGGPAAVLLIAAALLILVWSLVLDVAAIKGAYGLSGAKAVAVLAAPLAVVVAAAVILVVYAGATLFSGRF